jgi:ABC-type transport system involved in multi-copper enzyme maturation permease subunit
MIRGLLSKTLRETWGTTALFGGGLMLAMALLTYILPQLQQEIRDVLAKMPFVNLIFKAVLGLDVGEEITAQMLQAVLWVHPVVLALVWGHEIVFCTRVPAGEIDRGTIDILLGLPVSRRAVYLCETAAGLLSGVFVLLWGVAGHHLALPAMPVEMRPPWPRVVMVLANLVCVYVAVGGIAFCVSALSDRRGRALGLVFGLVLGSFLLNFLAYFWEPAQQIAFLSVMHYYQPADVLRSGQVPWADMFTLLAVGGAAWSCGSEIFARRSICTV